MNDIKLSPCPFCGKNVKIKKQRGKDWLGKPLPVKYYIACQCGIGTVKAYKTEKALIDVWNRRSLL